MRKSAAVINQIMKLKKAGHSIRKIAASLGVSRNTVRKYVKEYDENKPTKPLAGPSWAKKLDVEEIISELANGVTRKQLHIEHEVPVSYEQFTRYLNKRLPKPSPSFAIPLNHEAGEKSQVDYCDGLFVTDRESGKKRKTQFFCGVLPASSMTFGEFSWDQKTKSFLESHERMYAYYGGVTKYEVIDNLRAGVSRAHVYDPDVNPTFCDFANHYGFAVLPAKPRSPRHKACVEATIGAIQRDFFQAYRDYTFYSLQELNQIFRVYLDKFNHREMKDYGLSRRDRFEKEREKLRPLPKKPFELAEWTKAKVHPDSCVQVQKSFYSVPYRYIGRTLNIKISRSTVIAMDESFEFVASHTRVTVHKKSLKDEHYPEAALQQTQFSIEQAKKQAKKIGMMVSQYTEWQFDIRSPLTALRRVQGIIRLSKSLSNEAMEHAATQAIQHQDRGIRFFKNCAEAYHAQGGQLRSLSSNSAPLRKRDSINLH